MNRLLPCLLIAAACGASPSKPTLDMTTTNCALAANTSATGTASPSGCAVLARDVSACAAARAAAGIPELYGQFSCRVELTAGAGGVVARADGRPDHLSSYFVAGDACHESYTAAIQNPNTIAVQSYAVTFPTAPTTTGAPMTGAVLGLAVNGVPIYGNFAALGDDIFREAQTFDRCGAHPQMTGAYHYHSEPYAISYDDANLIGVLRDGYPIFGRRDADGTLPMLDASGGHTAVHAFSAGAPAYHYHVNEQTSTTPGTAGQKQWFLTTGTYRGTPGACTGC